MTPILSNDGRLDLADQAGHVEFLPSRQARSQDRRQAGCARGCAADRRRCPASASRPDTTAVTRVAERVAVADSPPRRAPKRPQHGERQSGAAARRVDGHVDRVAEAGDPRRLLAPIGQPFAPVVGPRCGIVVGRQALARRLGRIDPGPEVVRLAGPGKSAAGCPGRPWDRSRWPGCRRWPPLPAAPGTGPSCRCRSCRRRRRASSDPWRRKAEDPLVPSGPPHRTVGRGKKHPTSRNPAWLPRPRLSQGRTLYSSIPTRPPAATLLACHAIADWASRNSPSSRKSLHGPRPGRVRCP